MMHGQLKPLPKNNLIKIIKPGKNPKQNRNPCGKAEITPGYGGPKI